MNKWSRRIWFINGIGILIMLVWAAGKSVVDEFKGSPDRPEGPIVGKKLDTAIAESLALQDISIAMPRPISNSSYLFVPVGARDLIEPEPMRRVAYSSIGPKYINESNTLGGDRAINILFVNRDGSDPHLLLKKKAFIPLADIPQPGDSLQDFCIYKIVTTDSNGDGRLTWSDRFGLYYSDLQGRNLTPIIGDTVRVFAYAKSYAHQTIFILVGIPTDNKGANEDWPENVYAYDLREHRLSKLLQDNRVLDEARQLLRSQ
jgi:hypothetical protein